ncbi:hypothetical protein ACFQ1S_19190 [Kibdelosporangium lantanae]|uniref:PH domain-containing protein n=1 Tax=Kibdelosporangium lantanae TaxID=1497396 RepID=A0ABW3MAC0_9PSEU
MSAGRADLFDGERVLWEGSPTKFPVFDRADVVLVPFSVFWCGFAIFWTVTAISWGGGALFALFGVLFVVVGLYFVFGRLIARWLRLRGTTYTVTDRRVIVTSTAFGRRQEKSAYLKTLPPPVLTRGTGTTGTIKFGASNWMDDIRSGGGMFALGALTGRGTASLPPTLVHVNDSQQVRDIIAAAQVSKQV